MAGYDWKMAAISVTNSTWFVILLFMYSIRAFVYTCTLFFFFEYNLIAIISLLLVIIPV